MSARDASDRRSDREGGDRVDTAPRGCTATTGCSPRSWSSRPRPALRPEAVHAALGMALVMMHPAGVVYLAQNAPLLGVVQIFVYTGAVMMISLFVIMFDRRRLLRLDSIETIKGHRWRASLLLVIGLAGVLVFIAGQRCRGRADGRRPGWTGSTRSTPDRNVARDRASDLHQYVWTFEVTTRPAHHRRPRCDGAGAPRKLIAGGTQRRALAASATATTSTSPAAVPGCLRPAQRGRHPGAAARRVAVRPLCAGCCGPRPVLG